MNELIHTGKAIFLENQVSEEYGNSDKSAEYILEKTIHLRVSRD